MKKRKISIPTSVAILAEDAEVKIGPKAIAVDFDGTCVTNDWPRVGNNVPHCVEILKKLRDKDHKIILWTVRGGKELDDAINWFKSNNIKLYGVNHNPDQDSWNDGPVSEKIYYDILIDDRSLSTPLKTYNVLSDQPFVDWEAVEAELKRLQYL